RRIFSQDGNRFLFVTNNTLQIGNTITDEPPVSLPTANVPIISADFSRNGQFAVTMFGQEVSSGGTNFVLQVCETTHGTHRGTDIIITNDDSGISISDDGNYIATYATNLVQIWDVASNKLACPPLVFTQSVTAAVFAPGAMQLATVSGNLVEL